MSGANEHVQRLEVTVDGVPLSYLHARSPAGRPGCS